MSITYGFYNSTNGDRRYDASQMSRLFDGLIEDGVYETIGDTFRTKILNDNTITIGTGRAWFNHTWTLNDSEFPIVLQPSSVVLDRIDAIVLEVNNNDNVRENSIKAITGVAGTKPVRPELSNIEGIHQYPLSYIYRPAGSKSITAGAITNMVGTSDCPFVIGVVKTMNIDQFIESWGYQWSNWFNDKKETANHDFDSWLATSKSDFNVWFNELKVILEGDVVTNLTNHLMELYSKFNILAETGKIHTDLSISNSDRLENSYGDVLESTTIFTIL